MNYIILIIVGIAGIILGTYLGRRRAKNAREKQGKERLTKDYKNISKNQKLT